MAELGLGASQPSAPARPAAAGRAAPASRAANQYGTVPSTPGRVQTEDVDSIMADLGLGRPQSQCELC